MGTVRIQTPVRGLAWDIDIALYQQCLQIGNDLVPFRDPTTDVDILVSTLNAEKLAQELTAKMPDLSYISYMDGALATVDPNTKVTVYASAASNDSAPYALRLADGTLLCFFHTNEDGNYDIKLVSSTNNGVTWGGKVTVYTSGLVDRYAATLLLDNGDIICAFGTNEDGQYDIKCVRSDDSGATWGSKVTIYTSASDDDEPSLVLLDSGVILCTFQTDEDVNDDIKSVLSADNGVTWNPATKVSIAAGAVRYQIPYLIALSATELICVYYNNTAGTLFLSRSLDSGLTWSTPAEIYDSGATDLAPKIIRCLNGDLICTFGTREHGSYDIKYLISEDQGVTWPTATLADVYVTADIQSRSHTILLPNKELLFVFATNEDGNDDIKCVRTQWIGATAENGIAGDLYHYFIDADNPFIAVDGLTTIGRMFAMMLLVYLGQYVQTGDDYSDQIPDERAGLQFAHDLAVSLYKALNP